MRTLAIHLSPLVFQLTSLACTVYLVLFDRQYPVLTIAVLACLAILLVTLRIRHVEWTRLIPSGEWDTGTVTYVDHPKPSLVYLVVHLAAPVIGIFFFFYRGDGYLGLDARQWAMIGTSVFLWSSFYDLLPTEYTITSEGIWIRRSLYSIFTPFIEVARTRFIRSHLALSIGSLVYPACVRHSDYVVLSLKRSVRVMWWIKTRGYLLTPSNPAEFLSHLPSDIGSTT